MIELGKEAKQCSRKDGTTANKPGCFFFLRQFTSRSLGGRLISKAVFENASISGLGLGVS